MKGKQILQNLSPYQPGKQTEEIMQTYQLSRVVKLASNENPYGFSDQVKEALPSLAEHLEIYPDGYTTKLRKKLANQLNVNEDQLVFGGGSDEIIQIITRAFLSTDANTVMAKPTFTQYKHHSLIEGAEIREVETVNGHHQLDKMLEAIDDNTRIVWLCSPDNPSGTYISEKSFTSFMNKCSKDVLVVLDEAYIEFVDPEKRFNSVDHLATYENLIILRTFSKAYGLAGLRIGYGITNPHVSRLFDIVRGPFNTNSLAQQIALIALQDEVFIEETTRKNKQNKEAFKQFLHGIGWESFDSETNFLLIKTPVSGTEVFQYLLENGFIIRPGELLGYPNTIRVTIGRQEDMKELQDLLKAFQMKLNNEV